MKKEQNETNIDTIVTQALVLRVRLADADRIKAWIEEQGGRIIFQKMGVEPLMIVAKREYDDLVEKAGP
jgi:hypothetical protein